MAPCQACGVEIDTVISGRWCSPCFERLCVLRERLELSLVSMFSLSRRTVNAVVRRIPSGVILNGHGALEGRCIRWLEQVDDAELTPGRNVGRKAIAELRAAIPRNESEMAVCEHCGGSGRVRR
jgi:hypothetical protein